MVTITYLDPNDDAPKITWHGLLFRAQVPTEVDAKRFPDLLAQARTHPHFTVDDGEETAGEDEPSAADAAEGETPPASPAPKRSHHAKPK